jgi:hypothetical protein
VIWLLLCLKMQSPLASWHSLSFGKGALGVSEEPSQKRDRLQSAQASEPRVYPFALDR